MSLSKEILEGTDEKVRAYLAQGAPVNILDEYGYTPLIHATVLNKEKQVALLLKYQADPNLTDMTGSSALHWAVDNRNFPISQLLLNAGADPNAYNASGQPALFYPFLRKDKELTQLLLNKGADLNFTKDFIFAKLVGHRFELQGRSDLVDPNNLFFSIDLEGFYLEFTLDLIQESLDRFIHSYLAHRMDLHKDELKIIMETFEHAVQLRAFKHFNVNHSQHDETIRKLLNITPLLLPVSYKGHALTFIQYGDFIASCDRGVQKMTDPIIIYKVGNPGGLTPELYTHLLYGNHTEKYIKHDLPRELALKPYATLPIKHQITGNCSWANVEASVPTMLYMLLHTRLNQSSQLPALLKEIMHFYHTWLEWDKDRALEDWLRDFNTLSFQKQKSRAALIGVVLFQGCDPNHPEDLKRAQKILPILAKKEFHYIVRTYANIYIRSHKTQEGIRFKQLVEQCGYQLSEFNY